MPYLTPNQARLRDDIRGLIKGEIRCDEITLQLNSTDASILQIRPQGIVWPHNIDDVVAVVSYASQKSIPIHIKGLGTGTTGEALGSGIVLDFTRFMRRVVSLEHEAVTIQPGIIRNRLNHMLAKIQRRQFGPVSGFSPTTTIGSILARNGAGSNWLQYGFPSDHLLGLKVVLANGSILTLDRDKLPQAMEEPKKDSAAHVILKSPLTQRENDLGKGISLARGVLLGEEHAIADKIHRILVSNSEAIDAFSQFPETNRSGYRCHDVLKGPDQRNIDLCSLLAGSEGTLGIIVEAKLKTVSLPKRTAGAVLFFNGLEKAILSVESILPFSPVLCELIDRRRLTMIREGFPRFKNFLPIEAEAAIFVELNAGTIGHPFDDEEIRSHLSQLIETLQDNEGLCYDAIKFDSPGSFDLLDQLMHCAELILYRMQRSVQALPLFDDLAVPLPSLRQFLLDILALLRRHGITASISGHVGQGHLRVHPIIDLTQDQLVRSLTRLVEDVYSLTWKYKGTISSEFGTGLLKSQFLSDQFAEAMPIFRQIKEAFDPDNLLNPGKVIPGRTPWRHYIRKGLASRGSDFEDRQKNEDENSSVFSTKSSLSRENEELPESERLSSQLEMQLKWEPQQIFESTYRCNGCGDCLRLTPDRSNRMCPLFRRYMDEEAAPRAKANLLRGILENDLKLETLTTSKAKEVADRCFHCQMCSFECPAEVDVSQLAFRCKSAYVAAHGMPLDDLFFSRIDKILPWLSMISCPVNWALSTKWTRWLIEKTLQIPQNRTFPKLAKVTFLRRTQWTTLMSKPKSHTETRVALFIDTYANHFDTKLAELAVRILEHNGLEVYIPSRQRSSGLTAFTAGSIDRTERLARHNTRLLADLIRQGYRVVTLEPASASCLTKEYRYLVEGIDTALVSSNVVDFCNFLLERHREGKLRTDFNAVRGMVGYHAPCRSISNTVRRVDTVVPGEELLRLIPELDVRRIEQGCCGLAGTYGLRQKNHRRSLQIGMKLFKELRQPEINFGATDCCACQLQMEHGVNNKPTYHPIRFLAFAYGLETEFEQPFKTIIQNGS